MEQAQNLRVVQALGGFHCIIWNSILELDGVWDPLIFNGGVVIAGTNLKASVSH